jgi:hypothetical protein
VITASTIVCSDVMFIINLCSFYVNRFEK